MLAPVKFAIGPFTVSVTEEHCKNLRKLPRRVAYNYGHDSAFLRQVTRVPEHRGEILPTADLAGSTHGNNSHSILFPEFPGPDATYDLLLLLSFLTGRRIYLEHEVDWDPRRSYGEKIAGGKELIGVAAQAWSRLASVADHGLSDALSCLVMAPHSPDLIGWGAYANAALDSVVASWASRHGRTKFDDQSLVASARQTIEESLLTQGVSPETVGDIVVRFRNISSPSALTKIKWFLEGLQLFPTAPNDDQTSRLRRLNAVRNAIAHSGTVKIEKGLGPEASLSVAGAVIHLTHEIAELYIARNILGVDSAITRQSLNTIKSFFSDGTFRGQRVFEERFDDYLSRLEEKWLESGDI